MNTYAYVMGDPLMYIDPNGLLSLSDVATAVSDATGGCSSNSFGDDVVNNFVDVQDSTSLLKTPADGLENRFTGLSTMARCSGLEACRPCGARVLGRRKGMRPEALEELKVAVSRQNDLEVLLKEAYSFAKDGDYESAIALCDWLIADPATRSSGLRQRAAVREHQGEIKSAMADLEALVSGTDDEPADLYSLGHLYLQTGHWRDASKVLARGVDICIQEDIPYYLNPCRILYAEAQLQMKNGDVAAAALSQLPDDYTTYVYGRGNRTKAQMMVEASQISAALRKPADEG